MVRDHCAVCFLFRTHGLRVFCSKIAAFALSYACSRRSHRCLQRRRPETQSHCHQCAGRHECRGQVVHHSQRHRGPEQPGHGASGGVGVVMELNSCVEEYTPGTVRGAPVMRTDGVSALRRGLGHVTRAVFAGWCVTLVLLPCPRGTVLQRCQLHRDNVPKDNGEPIGRQRRPSTSQGAQEAAAAAKRVRGRGAVVIKAVGLRGRGARCCSRDMQPCGR